MCIRDRAQTVDQISVETAHSVTAPGRKSSIAGVPSLPAGTVSYTHLRAHETVLDLVCRLLLEKKHLQLCMTTYTGLSTTTHTECLTQF